MADLPPKAILNEGGPYQFNFNDGVNTFLQPGFDIPKAVPNARGQAKKERGVLLGMGDYNRLPIPLPFRLAASSTDDFFTRQSVLLKALQQPRSVFTWNPNPGTGPDLYFDTYSSELETVLSSSLFLKYWAMLKIDLLSDPFPYPAESTIFDTVAILGQVDGESGEWTGSGTYSRDTTRYRQGSMSMRTTGATAASSWLKRILIRASPAEKATNLTAFSPIGWVTAALHFDSLPANLLNVRVYIGTAGFNYRWYDLTAPFGESAFHAGWQTLFFNFNAPTGTTGTVVGFDYFYAEVNVSSGDGPAFNIDNVHIVNGKVCNVRGQTPLPVTVYGVGGEYDCGFKADIRAGAGAQFLISADHGETIGEYSLDGALSGDALAFDTGAGWLGPVEGTYMLMHTGVSHASAYGFHRIPAAGLDLSSLSATGIVSFAVAGRCTGSGLETLSAEIRIGNDVTHYVKTTVTLFEAGGQWYPPRTLAFNISDMVAGVGTVTWTSDINYIGFSFTKTGATSVTSIVLIDNMVIKEPGSSIDLMTITEGSGIEAAPGVISLPESSPAAPAGHTWEATPASTALAGTFGGKFYRYTMTTTEKYIFPAKLVGSLYPGEHNIQARLRTLDTAGGNARLCGYDVYSGEWSFGEMVTVGYNAGKFQTVDLGSLSLPFNGWHRDATPASMFSILGLAVTSVTATQLWDINVLIPAPVAGGGRHFTPTVGQRFSCFDTRYINSEIYSQGPAANANYQSAARRRTVGDLKTLKVGVNNLLINASDSSSPDSCSSIDLTKLTTVQRLKNGAP